MNYARDRPIAPPTYHALKSTRTPEPQRYSTKSYLSWRHPAFSVFCFGADKKPKPRKPRKLKRLPVLLSPSAIDAYQFGTRKAMSCSCSHYRCAELEEQTPTGERGHWCGYYGSSVHEHNGNPERCRECRESGGR